LTIDKMTHPSIILQQKLHNENIQYLLVPSSDTHGNEYAAVEESFRQYVSDFAGSAGDVIISVDGTNRLFTDSRYWSIAEKALPDNFVLMKSPDKTIDNFLNEHLTGGLAVDFRCVSVGRGRELEQLCKDKNCVLKDVRWVEEIWDLESDDRKRPPRTSNKLRHHKITNVTVKDKIEDLKYHMKENDITWNLITELDQVSWLFNIRGSFPLYHCFIKGIVFCTKTTKSTDSINNKSTDDLNVYDISLFTDDFDDASKESNDSRREIEAAGVVIRTFKSFYNLTDEFQFIMKNSNLTSSGIMNQDKVNLASGLRLIELLKVGNVEFDENSKELPITGLFEQLDIQSNPLFDKKAIKNSIELDGYRAAHIADGLALSICLAELELMSGEDRMKLDEHQIAQRLENLRSCPNRLTAATYRGLSFKSIVGVGANAASPHHSVNEKNPTKFNEDAFLLIDSGAHYDGGTTDVTRTVAFRELNKEGDEKLKETWSLVMKGFINMSSANFPDGTYNVVLDGYARSPLWNAGLDYGHGTSHGVGQCLGVHEFPPLINTQPKHPLNGDGRLKKGMVMSIEPGYYKDNEYGIRHENLVIVKESNFNENFLAFEQLTFVPFQVRRCLNVDMMTKKEIEWLNTYQLQTRKILTEQLDEEYTCRPNSTLFSKLKYEEIKGWLIKETMCL